MVDNKYIKVAIIGATGMVGKSFLQILEEFNLPIDEYWLFSSKKSAGTTIKFMGKSYTVHELTDSSFDEGFNYALFSAGSDVSKKYAPIAASKNCVVIDNSSYWRMDPSVPLVVPFVNPQDIKKHNGIIANPNCSTIQAVIALAPIHREYKIKRIIYSTYQSVSGAGKLGCNDLENGIKSYLDKDIKDLQKFLYPIFDNCIPQIDSFLDNGYTKEEQKMIEETQKILHAEDLPITATTVRVPIFNCHSESINIELEKEFDVEDIKSLLSESPGIILKDNIQTNKYPMPMYCSGHDEVFVGRIRRDYSIKNGLNIWVVADNIRRGAATNAVEILYKLIMN